MEKNVRLSLVEAKCPKIWKPNKGYVYVNLLLNMLWSRKDASNNDIWNKSLFHLRQDLIKTCFKNIDTYKKKEIKVWKSL